MKKILSVLLTLLFLASSCTPCFAANTDLYDKGIQSIILEDSSDLLIEITDYGFEPLNNAYTVELFVVNKSGSPIEYGIDYAAVNGYIVNSYMYSITAADRRNICYLEILSDDIFNIGLETPDEISFRLYANVTKENGCSPLFSDDVTINVSGRSSPYTGTRSFDDFPSELEFCNEFIKFEVYDSKRLDGSPFYQVDCVAENPNDFDVTLTCSNMNVDGIYTSPYWLCRIPAGYRTLTSIFIDADEMAAFGVFNYDHIAFSLMLYEGFPDLWDTGSPSQPFFAYPLSFFPRKG